MKLLAIENGSGYFLNDEGALVSIEEITKDDLLRLVSLTLDEDVEFEDYNEDLVKNQAHRIIYKRVWEKLTDLQGRKQEFKDQSERLYLPAYNRYRDSEAVSEGNNPSSGGEH